MPDPAEFERPEPDRFSPMAVFGIVAVILIAVVSAAAAGYSAFSDGEHPEKMAQEQAADSSAARGIDMTGIDTVTSDAMDAIEGAAADAVEETSVSIRKSISGRVADAVLSLVPARLRSLAIRSGPVMATTSVPSPEEDGAAGAETEGSDGTIQDSDTAEGVDDTDENAGQQSLVRAMFGFWKVAWTQSWPFMREVSSGTWAFVADIIADDDDPTVRTDTR